MSVITFGGSRALQSTPLVGQVVSAALASGASLRVGCAVGADAQVIRAVIQQRAVGRLQVFAAFGASGAGAWGGSALLQVQAAARAGASVAWLAGGALSVPLRARLLLRSVAALQGSSAFVVFLAGPWSPGSLAVAARAAAAGQPVFAFVGPCGAGAAPVALVGVPGQWVPSSFAGFSCWAWRGQPSLF